MRLRTLRLRLAVVLLAAASSGALVYAALTDWPVPQVREWLAETIGTEWQRLLPGSAAAALIAAAFLVLLALWMSQLLLGPLLQLVRALESAVASYRDGDFSTSIAARGDNELSALVQQHNGLGDALRTQRQHLVERELMLDTVVQNTPVALVLCDARERVVHANIAARHLLGGGRSLEGSDFSALLQRSPAAMQRAVEAGEDTLFSVTMEGGEETFHLSQRSFHLQGRPHRLRLFRRLTHELSRQEVATWKRVIRVISHELNNSLAPISSMAHSGGELLRRGDLDRLPGVLVTIGERARHLHGFLDAYARFAKLPSPQPTVVAWSPFLASLAEHCRFRRSSELPGEPGWFDAGQIEQALINLLKNALEAGGPEDGITLGVSSNPREQRFEVADRGPGMSETVMDQALLPFYSTKRSGTGLGLALAREIAEAHGGRIALAHCEGGGLRVTISLPARVTG